MVEGHIPTDYHKKVLDITADIINHGYGKVEIDIVSMKDNTVKVTIIAGRSWVFFIKKDISIDKLSLL